MTTDLSSLRLSLGLALAAILVPHYMSIIGGAYGFARVSLGIFMGYLVGCLETLQYIMYVAASILSIGQIVTASTGLSRDWEPYWWALFYISTLTVHFIGGRLFWRLNLVIAVVITIIPVIYCFSAIPSADIVRYTKWSEPQPHYFIGGMSHFLASLPLASWLFVGVEALPLSSEDVKNVSMEMAGRGLRGEGAKEGQPG